MRLTSARHKKTLGIFWVGEFGHLIMNVIPRINKIRLERPDWHIIIASFDGDHIYFRDNKSDWTIDEYIPIEWWPSDRGCHQVKSKLTGDAKNAIIALEGLCDEIWLTHNWTLKDYSKEFKEKPIIAYPFKDIIKEDRIDDEPHFIVMSRAKNYSGSFFRSWDGLRWNKFLEEVIKYTGLKAYVCGVEKESVQFNWSDKIINFTNISNRSAKTLNVMSNAEFCIGDCSGSSNYAIQCGIPTFVSGPPEYAPAFLKKKNYFETYVEYQNAKMDALTAEDRFAAFKKFFKNYTKVLGKDIYET